MILSHGRLPIPPHRHIMIDYCELAVYQGDTFNLYSGGLYLFALCILGSSYFGHWPYTRNLYFVPTYSLVRIVKRRAGSWWVGMDLNHRAVKTRFTDWRNRPLCHLPKLWEPTTLSDWESSLPNVSIAQSLHVSVSEGFFFDRSFRRMYLQHNRRRVWRRGWDSNPRAVADLLVFKTRLLSRLSTSPELVAGMGLEPTIFGVWTQYVTITIPCDIWWRRRDLNPCYRRERAVS